MNARRQLGVFAAIVLVAVVLRWPALDAGLHLDDIAQRVMVAGEFSVARPWWNLFDFTGTEPADVAALRSNGFLPWWADDDLRLRGFRPSASALLWFDIAILRTPFAAHVHSLLWWIALLVVLHRFLRRVLPDRWALVAVALYALDDGHTSPLAWLANRAAIVSMVFALAAVHAHVRAREDGWARGRWLAPVLAAVSVSAGEYGIAGLAFVLAYEIAGATGPTRDRVRAIVPFVAVVLAYLAFHQRLGFGAANSSIYVDPLVDPILWLRMLSERVPMLLTDMLLGVPIGRQRALGVPPLLLAAGALVVIGVWLALVWRRFDPLHRRRIKWLGLGALGALLPLASAFLSGRLTLVSGVGTYVTLAGLLVGAADRVASERHRVATWVAAAAALGLACMHGPFAVLSGRAELASLAKLNRITSLLAETMPVDDREAARQRWVVLNAVDPMMMRYPPLQRWIDGHPLPAAWTVLSMAPGAHRFERVSPHALEVSVEEGALLKSRLEGMFRRPSRPLRTGDTIDLEGLVVEIVTATDDAGVQRVRFTFDHELEHPSSKFFVFGADGLREHAFGPPGTVLTVPPTPPSTELDEAALVRTE